MFLGHMQMVESENNVNSIGVIFSHGNCYSGRMLQGKAGPDLEINVPPGVIIKKDDGTILGLASTEILIKQNLMQPVQMSLL